MTSVPIPMCISCDNLHQTPGEMTCDAFPNGIPLVITDSEFDHRLPFPGDNGIMFEQNPTMPVPRFEDYDFSVASTQDVGY